MTLEHREGAAESAHEAVWTLLPWYADGTLSHADAERAREHVAECAACRDEAERCRQLSAAARTYEESDWAPSPAHFAKVMAHIDAAEGRRTSAASRRDSPGWIASLRAWMFDTPSPVRWALGVQGALIAVAAGLLLNNMSAPTRYETMSSSAEQVAGNRAQLRVVFSDELSLKELHELLQGVGAQIVSGPGSAGAYTVALPFTATDTARIAEALAALRQSSKVQLAEPVATNSVR
jgi:Putative zinc-finger